MHQMRIISRQGTGLCHDRVESQLMQGSPQYIVSHRYYHGSSLSENIDIALEKDSA